MKREILVFAVAVSAAAFGAGKPIDAIYTVPHELDQLLVSGHIQGACCSEKAIYLSHRIGLEKVGWDGKVIKHIDAPAHLGDSAFYKGRVYGVFGFKDGKEGEKGKICVWDEDLNLIKEAYSDYSLDGAVVLNDTIYTSPDVYGDKPHPKLKIAMYDLNLKFRGIREIDPGYWVHFGTQTMATDGKDIFLGNYGAAADQGNPNRYCCSVYTPDLKLVRNLEFGCSEGFGLVPQSVSKRETPVFFAVRALGGDGDLLHAGSHAERENENG